MRGKIPKSVLMGMLAIGMVGCGAPATAPVASEAVPAGTAAAEIPTMQLSDQILPHEMVDGLDPELNAGQDIQQRRRRPSIRWRRSFRQGRPYYVPYYYYYWYPQPYYQPYYSGVDWYYYDRPGFRYNRRRFRRI